MYSLSPGYRIPALQRGLSPAEVLLTKATAGAGGAVLMSALISPPPLWAFGAVGAAAAVLNVAPGPRSVGRWATVGWRHWRERAVPPAVFARAGATATWALYPEHGTMQDPQRRTFWHEQFGRALVFAAAQARTAGIQVHVTHHADEGEAGTAHTQTVSVHVPKGLVARPERVLNTLKSEFARLGTLARLDPGPLPEVTGRGPGWVQVDGGRYAATARVTAWPQEAEGDLMRRLLLDQNQDQDQDEDGPDEQDKPNAPVGRSFAVLYRPLPAGQSRRAAKWQSAGAEAWTTDKVRQEVNAAASGTTREALVQGAVLVDVDAYLTVWATSPEEVTEARWQTVLAADRQRLRLDWLPGQQHRALAMTTPHGATTQKGAVL